MADNWIRNKPADFVQRTTDDGNVKIANGADPPSVVVGPEGDVFGDVIDAVYWNVFTGSYTESGGVLTADDPGVGGGTTGIWREVIYETTVDLALNILDSKPSVETYFTYIIFALYTNPPGAPFNQINMVFYPREGAGAQKIRARKHINGVITILAEVDLGNQVQLTMRISRRNVDNFCWFFYDIGAGWVLLWSGVISDVTHFPVGVDLKPAIQTGKNATPDVWEPEFTPYYQVIGIPAQEFWPDSPESLIVKSDDGAVEYFEEAGVGGTFVLTGASAVQDEDGGTNRYKVGFSDNGVAATATWDAGWLTVAQVNTNAAGGSYDGHRYLHVKIQLNSDGTQANEITSFTFSGDKISVGIASDMFESSLFGSKMFGRN